MKRGDEIDENEFIDCTRYFPQSNQTAHNHMLYLDRLSRPKVSRNATTPGFWLPSNGHLLEIMPIQGLSFTTFKENVPIFSLKHKINEFSLNFWRLFCIQRILKYPWIQMNTDWSWLVTHVQYLYTIYPAVENIAYTRFQLISVTLISLVFPF